MSNTVDPVAKTAAKTAAKTEPTKSSFMRTLFATGLAIMAIFFIDTVLEKTERAESRVDAARFYASGQRLLAQGQSAAAVDQFRSAIAADRSDATGNNQDYQLALGQALLAAGRLGDAADTLNDLLQRNPVGAAANLTMARLLVKEDQIDDAESYYHRAIYGQWRADARANQVQVRFELTDLLSRQNSKEALLAELLPLEDEAPGDIATRKKLGHLFIAAGSPARAADIFHDLLHKNPQDAEAYTGLGEAEFARANYRAAQTDFQAALRLEPVNPDAQQGLDLCVQVLDLDPARRGLSAEEQYRRSRKLVELVLDDVVQCVDANASVVDRELILTVQDSLKKPVPAAQRSDAFDDNLDWADRLWQIRKTSCGRPIAASEEPLALVLATLAE